MNWDIGAVFEQIVASFTKLPLAQKVAIPVLLAGSVFAIVFVSNWASRPDYQTLYSNLDEADAGAVVEALKERKVSFKLRDDGKTIDINPPEMVSQLKIELASLGLPKGNSSGFELFNESTLGQTGFVEQINFVRALQGELERTIVAIESVKTARVHIQIPKRSLFVKRDAPPTASVMLTLKAGRELDPAQVKGIAHLVSGSVERLTPDNVTVMDSRGKMLNERHDEEIAGGADVTRLQYKQRIEEGFVKRIESMLDAVLGPGRAVARVTADVDFSKYEKEEEAYDPAGQVVRSERAVEESAGLTAEGGVPGVISNLTNDPGLLTPPDSASNNNLRTEKVKNFEVSRSVSKTVSATGSIERLTVAVMVDGQYVQVPSEAPAADATAVAQKMYQPLSVEMLNKIENLVKQTVGFDTARGDVITVENIPFYQIDEADLPKPGGWKDMIITWLFRNFWTALFFVLMILFVRPLIKFLVTPSDAEVDLSRLLPTGIKELEAELSAEREKMTSLPTYSEPEIDLEEVEGMLAENSRLVKDNPQQAALLIRYWLSESGPF